MMANVEILYTAWNRLNFVGLTWALLMNNTDWTKVRKLTVYDDGSEDGTLELLRDKVLKCPVECELRETDLRSPPAIMNHFFAEKRAPLVAKIDSDICCPPGWLTALMSVMKKEPRLELLGSEAGQTRRPTEDDKGYTWTGSSHIGGVGLFRTSAFEKYPAIPSRGYFGFGDWQTRYRLVRGWITPDLMMPQIDRVPVEPWLSYTKEYVDKGINRNWGSYPRDATSYWDWIQECL